MAGPGLEWEQLALMSCLSRLTVLDLDLGPSTSNSYKDSHEWLLFDVATLPSLEQLILQQLAVQPMSLSLLSELTTLRLLYVISSVRSAQDFSCLPQITSLQFCQASHKLVTITLPQGDLVALKVLNLNSCCRVMGLDAATQLTAIQVSGYQYSHGTVQWPTSLPHLQNFFVSGVNFHGLCQALPEQWQHYINLITICLLPVESPGLPEWFSVFQKLDYLEIYESKFDLFPSCLSQLCGLNSLDLGDLAEIKITADIVGLASLPLLSHLYSGEMINAEHEGTGLDEGQKRINEEEEEYLDELEDALLTRLVPLIRTFTIRHSYDIVESTETSDVE